MVNVKLEYVSSVVLNVEFNSNDDDDEDDGDAELAMYPMICALIVHMCHGAFSKRKQVDTKISMRVTRCD